MNIKTFAAGCVALTLAACGPASNTAAGQCDVRTSKAWTVAANQTLSVEAMSSGSSCKVAVVTIAIRAPSGEPVWVESHIGAQLMGFQDVTTSAAMTKALGQWISQSDATMASTDKLPDWPAGAAAPQAGEFPFYPGDGFDRDAYMKLRGAKQPMLCYVQGMESMACVANSSDGGITKVGVQTFPG